MSNTYFQFKQFLINQEKSGMKVTTDGCLFGAWVADQVKGKNPSNILDIGTGTGLLSLMLAQATKNSQIDAIEINELAFEEATENFQESIWNERLNCIESSLQEFRSKSTYDLIISNPPFFKNNYKGKDTGKNQAIHSDHLSVEELIDGVKRNLKPNGKAYILYPEREMNQITIEAEKANLLLNRLTTVKNKNNDSLFRSMGQFSYQKSEVAKHELIIRENDGTYTNEFWKLLEEYYL